MVTSKTRLVVMYGVPSVPKYKEKISLVKYLTFNGNDSSMEMATESLFCRGVGHFPRHSLLEEENIC